MSARSKVPRFRCGTGAAAVAGLILALAGGARAEGPKPVTRAEFRADVTRLQHLVSACESAAAACTPAQVGPDEQVGESDRQARSGPSFALHWQWLRDSLAQAATAKDGREPLLADAAARLNDIAQETQGAASPVNQPASDFARARAAANSVLAGAEFQADEPTWWDRQKAKFFPLLARIFGGVGRLGRAAPWIGKLLEWLLFFSAGVGLLLVLLRHAARQRLRLSLQGPRARAATWDREATDWEQLAETHAAAGQWRDAVHGLYWAAIVLLESRRAWRHNPARTPREYVRLLRDGSAQQETLRGLTRSLERVWYGQRPAGQEEFTQARRLYESLRAGAEAVRPPSAAAPAKLAGTA